MGKTAYSADQCGRTNAWKWDPTRLVIVGVDVEVDDDNRVFYCRRAMAPVDEAFIRNVRTHGVRVPITIKKQNNTAYVLTGRRRVIANRLALQRCIDEGDELGAKALKAIMCRESTARTQQQLLSEVIIENEHREDDSPMGRAEKMAHARYLDLSHEDIAELFDCSAELVRNMLQIHDDLVPAAQEKLETGELPLDAALEMARHMQPAEQKKHLKKITGAPKGKKKAAAQKAAGRNVTKAPKLRFVKDLVEHLSDEQREAILWARGVIRDEDVTFSSTIAEALKVDKPKKGKSTKKDERQQDLPGTEG